MINITQQPDFIVAGVLIWLVGTTSTEAVITRYPCLLWFSPKGIGFREGAVE